MADYARPHFEKLLVQRRKEAVEAINRAKSDIQDQYNKELKKKNSCGDNWGIPKCSCVSR